MSRSGQERAPTGSARSSPSATVRSMPLRHCAFPPWRWSGAEESAELALACDFLVAAEDATFFAVGIRSGNIPLAGGLQRLAERVGRARAAKLALLGEPFSGSIAG